MPPPNTLSWSYSTHAWPFVIASAGSSNSKENVLACFKKVPFRGSDKDLIFALQGISKLDGLKSKSGIIKFKLSNKSDFPNKSALLPITIWFVSLSISTTYSGLSLEIPSPLLCPIV